jgi:hypothetical protein
MKRFTVLLALLVAMAFTLTSCFEPKPQSVEQQQMEKKQKAAASLMKKQETTAISFSMDRYLHIQKLERFNDPNKMTYCYLFLMNGQVLEMSIVGKMASSAKRLTRTHQRLEDWDYGANYGDQWAEAPDEMGMYGPSSGSGKLAMTTFGSLLEIGGFFSYIYSEVPLTFANLKVPIVKFEIRATAAEKAALLKSLNKAKQEAK